MATFNWPGFGITAITPTLDQPAQVNRSAYTGVRAVASNPWHGKWSFKVQLASRQGDANFQAIRAFFTGLQGSINNFHLPAVEAPQNANTGVTVATYAAQGATSLALTGLTTALAAGNMITIAGQLLSLTSVGTLSGSAQTVNFQPALRAAALPVLAAPTLNAPSTATTGGTLAAATYYYKVTALSGTGQTLGSNEVSQVTTGTTSTVSLSWNAIAGATGYRVYRGTAAGAESVYYAPGNVTSFTDTGAANTAGTVPVSNTTVATSVETGKPYALVALTDSAFSWDIAQWRQYGLSFTVDEDVGGIDGAAPSGDLWTAPVISGTSGLNTPTDVVLALAAPTGAGMIGTSAGGTVQSFISNLGVFGALAAIFAAPAFTNTAYASSAQFLTNGATPGTMYSSQQGGTNATESLTSAIIVPSAATNHQTNALSAYIRSDRAQVGNGGDVGAYIQAVSNASGSAIFAINALMADTAGKTGQILSNEFDVNVNAADTTVTGLNLVLVANTTLTGSRNAFRAAKAFGTNGWSNAFVTADGAIDLYAFFIGSQTSVAGTARNSQQIAWVSYNSSNTRYIATMGGDSGGGMYLRPGLTSSAIAFQNTAGSANWAYVNSLGLTLPSGGNLTIGELAAASVSAPGSGSQTLFIDTADHKLKRKDSTGTVTIIA